MRRREFWAFFILPAAGIIVLFFLQSALNREFLKRKTEALVREQLTASARILAAEFEERLKEGALPQTALDRYSGETDIYFLALVDETGNVLGWSSQFEGYLPIAGRPASDPESWAIDSPAGTILNVVRTFPAKEGRVYSLYLGYSLSRLDEMLAYSRRSALLLFGALGAVGLLLFSGIYRMHRASLARTEEAAGERQEKERFRELSGFTAGIAHEIKNPLNSLALLCEMMEKNAPHALAGDAALGRIEVQKISRILDRFSAVLRPLDLRLETIEADAVIGDAVEAASPAAVSKGIPVRWEPGPGRRLRADRGLLAQALFNVVRNGLEASAGGEIVIRAEKNKAGVLISVEDSGPGIPAADRDRIFEPFFSTKADGLGVGLFLARKIVEAHGGRISAADRKSGGSVFRIELPGEKG